MYAHFSYVSTSKYLLVKNKFSKKKRVGGGGGGGVDRITIFRGGLLGKRG